MHLVYRTAKGETRAFDLAGKSRITLGREEGRDLVLEGALVSRHHATVERVEGCFFLRDHASANGTFLNGLRLTGTRAIMLREGDVVEVGSAWLLVSATPDPAARSRRTEHPEGDETSFEAPDLILDGLAAWTARPEAEHQAWDEALAALQGPGQAAPVERLLGTVSVQARVDGLALFLAGEPGSPTAPRAAYPGDLPARRLEAIAGRALSSGAARLAVPRAPVEAAPAAPSNETMKSPRTLASAAVPFHAPGEGRCLGVLAVERFAPRLDRTDLALLSVFADRIGRALVPTPARELS